VAKAINAPATSSIEAALCERRENVRSASAEGNATHGGGQTARTVATYEARRGDAREWQQRRESDAT